MATRLTQHVVESLSRPDRQALASQVVVEALAPTPDVIITSARITQAATELIYRPNRNALLTQVALEYLTDQYLDPSTVESDVDSDWNVFACAATTITLTISEPSITYGETVTLTAFIPAGASGPVTGQVHFYEGDPSEDPDTWSFLGSAFLSPSGYAVLYASTIFPVGVHTIIASYEGDGNYCASTTSGTLTVNPPPPQTGCQGPFCHGTGGACGCDCKCCPPPCCPKVTVCFECGAGQSGINPSGCDLIWYSEYLHLDQPIVQTGQPIDLGDKIGVIGDIEDLGPHLHFGVGGGEPGAPDSAGQTIDLTAHLGFPQVGTRADGPGPGPSSLVGEDLAFVLAHTESPVDAGHCEWFEFLGSPFHVGAEYYAQDLNCTDFTHLGADVYCACGGPGVESVVDNIQDRGGIGWSVIIRHRRLPAVFPLAMPAFDLGPISSPDGRFLFGTGLACSVPCNTVCVAVRPSDPKPVCCIELLDGNMFAVGNGWVTAPETITATNGCGQYKVLLNNKVPPIFVNDCEEILVDLIPQDECCICRRVSIHCGSAPTQQSLRARGIAARSLLKIQKSRLLGKTRINPVTGRPVVVLDKAELRRRLQERLKSSRRRRK